MLPPTAVKKQAWNSELDFPWWQSVCLEMGLRTFWAQPRYHHLSFPFLYPWSCIQWHPIHIILHTSSGRYGLLLGLCACLISYLWGRVVSLWVCSRRNFPEGLVNEQEHSPNGERRNRTKNFVITAYTDQREREWKSIGNPPVCPTEQEALNSQII